MTSSRRAIGGRRGRTFLGSSPFRLREPASGGLGLRLRGRPRPAGRAAAAPRPGPATRTAAWRARPGPRRARDRPRSRPPRGRGREPGPAPPSRVAGPRRPASAAARSSASRDAVALDRLEVRGEPPVAQLEPGQGDPRGLVGFASLALRRRRARTAPRPAHAAVASAASRSAIARVGLGLRSRSRRSGRDASRAAASCQRAWVDGKQRRCQLVADRSSGSPAVRPGPPGGVPAAGARRGCRRPGRGSPPTRPAAPRPCAGVARGDGHRRPPRTAAAAPRAAGRAPGRPCPGR